MDTQTYHTKGRCRFKETVAPPVQESVLKRYGVDFSCCPLGAMAMICNGSDHSVLLLLFGRSFRSIFYRVLLHSDVLHKRALWPHDSHLTSNVHRITRW